MATTGKNNPAAIITKIDQLEAGVTKDIVGKATVTVAGTAMTAAQINAQLGTADTLYGAVTAARVALKTALTAWEAALPGLKLFVKNLESGLKTSFGVDSTQLLDFGIKPASAKAKPRTAAEKAVSAALSKQTRAVRGTGGKNQKAATTATGKPGLVLVGADGTPVAGNLIAGPTPAGSSTPVDAAANLAPVGSSTGGSTPSGSGSVVPPTPSGK